MFRFYQNCVVTDCSAKRGDTHDFDAGRVVAGGAGGVGWSCPSSSSSSSFRRRAAKAEEEEETVLLPNVEAARDDDDDDVVNGSDADRADAGPDAFSGSILQDVRKGQDGFTTELRIKRPGGEKDQSGSESVSDSRGYRRNHLQFAYLGRSDFTRRRRGRSGDV